MTIDVWFPVDSSRKGEGAPATYVVDASSVARSPPPPIDSLLSTSEENLASLIEDGTCITDLLVPLSGEVHTGYSFDADSDTPAFPLVIYSHGSGGNPFDHIDLMKRLASHGFVVAAVTHAGDSLVDHVVGSAKGALDSTEDVMCNRAKDVRDAITYMTTELSSDSFAGIDPSKIAVVGLSSGGFAALSSVLGYGGAAPGGSCDFEDGSSVALPDERVGAVIAMAPHTKDLFTDEEAGALSTPVLILDGEGDTVTPPSENVASLFPSLKCTAEESVLIQLTNGGHPSFQDLCHDSDLVQGISEEAPQVDPPVCAGVLPALSSYYYSLIGAYAAVGCPGDEFVDPFSGIIVEAEAEHGPVTPITTAHDVTGFYAVSYLKYVLGGEDEYKSYLEKGDATSGLADEIDSDTSFFIDDDGEDCGGVQPITNSLRAGTAAKE